MMKVISAARPSFFSAAKRVSMRVVMRSLTREPAAARRRHAHIHGAEKGAANRHDEIDPFLVFNRRSGNEQPRLDEINDVAGRPHDQNPADDFLAVHHPWLFKYAST